MGELALEMYKARSTGHVMTDGARVIRPSPLLLQAFPRVPTFWSARRAVEQQPLHILFAQSQSKINLGSMDTAVTACGGPPHNYVPPTTMFLVLFRRQLHEVRCLLMRTCLKICKTPQCSVPLLSELSWPSSFSQRRLFPAISGTSV